MSFRINTNVDSMRSLAALNKTGDEMSVRQLRLATGSKINRAEDDSAGYSIARKLESKTRSQAQALSNIGDAKSLLTVAEGSLGSTMDILMSMKEKVVQAANDTLGATERTAIQNELDAMVSEVNDIAANTEFNGHNLLDASGGDGAGSFSFQVGSTATDTFTVDLSATLTDDASLGIDALDTTDATTSATAITAIDTAIETVSGYLSGIGDSQKRLSFKSDNLETSKTNYESARSRIEDADFAQEQMNIVKLQILQQTGTAAFAQANAAPQSVLSLF
jgi:flagellin